MAFSTNGGGYRSGRRATHALSEINVTPFVDVVLVLPIIFMLTAAVLEFGIEVNINDLATVIKQKYGKAKGVYVRADKETIWDPIAQVTAELGAAGFQVNMVTQPEDSSSKGRR